jgi:hypothetical protein
LIGKNINFLLVLLSALQLVIGHLIYNIKTYGSTFYKRVIFNLCIKNLSVITADKANGWQSKENIFRIFIGNRGRWTSSHINDWLD